jgi:hypothetical protein
MWGAGWSGVDNSFKKAERNFIETGKLLQLYEINPTLSDSRLETKDCGSWRGDPVRLGLSEANKPTCLLQA